MDTTYLCHTTYGAVRCKEYTPTYICNTVLQGMCYETSMTAADVRSMPRGVSAAPPPRLRATWYVLMSAMPSLYRVETRTLKKWQASNALGSS